MLPAEIIPSSGLSALRPASCASLTIEESFFVRTASTGGSAIAMTSVVPMTPRRRTDEVTDGGIPDDVLGNAPERRDGFYSVPKVIE